MFGAALHSVEKWPIRLQLKHFILFLSVFLFPPRQPLELRCLLSEWSSLPFSWSWFWPLLPYPPLEFLPRPRPRKPPQELFPVFFDVWAIKTWLSVGFSDSLSNTLCSCASKQPWSSSTFISSIFFVFSIVITRWSNLGLRVLKIFSTIDRSFIFFPQPFIAFVRVITRLKYSAIFSLLPICINSYWRRKVCNLTFFNFSAPSYHCSKISQASFEVAAPTIFSKCGSSTHWWIKTVALQSFFLFSF